MNRCFYKIVLQVESAQLPVLISVYKS